jgi:hypothetical protein
MSVGCLKDGRWYCQYYVATKTKRDYFGRGIEGEKKATRYLNQFGWNIEKVIDVLQMPPEQLALLGLIIRGHKSGTTPVSPIPYKNEFSSAISVQNRETAEGLAPIP